MGALLDRLADKRILVSDGAWGTQLQAKGLEPGSCPELWNIERYERVRALAAAYVAAGADLILTNTFGGSPQALARYGLEGRLEELNGAGARLSLEAVGGAVAAAGGRDADVPEQPVRQLPGGQRALVAASIGPTGELLAPLGVWTEAEMEQAFRRQIRAVVEAGVRVLCVETMISVEEACSAVRAARLVGSELGVSLEVMATMTFERTPQGFRTVMGVDIPQAVEELTRAGADVLGSNCGNGIEQMVPIAAEFRRLTGKPILIQANAGLPVLEGDRAVYLQTPEIMARWVPELASAGADIIGGCCGTGPEHIAAIRREIDRLR